jgi:predicted transcriptional regulator YdeE
MKNQYHYASVLEALNELKLLGFSDDFNLEEEHISNHPDQYEITHVYRYEGNSNPSDSAVVYGISALNGKKGVFVAGFSANSSSKAAEVLGELSIKGRDS